MKSLDEFDHAARQLVAQAVDDDLTDTEFNAFDRLLADNRDAAAAYVECLQLHTDLYFLAHERRSSSACEKILVELAAKPGAGEVPVTWWGGAWQFFSRPTPLSIAVALLIVGSMVTALAMVTAPLYRSHSEKAAANRQSTTIVAEITATQHAQWADGQIGGHRGASLVAGHRLSLLAGVVEVTYRDGVTVVLAGPSEFVVGELGSGRLDAGRLVATVPEQAIGFQVETTAATITDLSTQFGVVVGGQGAVSVHVIEGRVRAQPKLGTPQAAVEIFAGQSLHFAGQWRKLATRSSEREQLRSLLAVRQAAVPLLSIDFQPGSDSQTQAGFQPFTEADAQAGRTYDSTVGPLHVAIAGQDAHEKGFFARNRITNSEQFTSADLYNDFAFHNTGGTLRLSIAGVEPHREYDLRLYCWDTFETAKFGRRHTNLFVALGETTGRQSSMTFDATTPVVSNHQFAAQMRVQSSTSVLSIEIRPHSGAVTRLNGLELFAAPQSDGEANGPQP